MKKLKNIEHEKQAQYWADNLTHQDQEVPLDILENDIGTIFDMQGDIELELIDVNRDETNTIIDRAFEIARTNTN